MGNKHCCCEQNALYDLGVDKELFLQMIAKEVDLAKFSYLDKRTSDTLKR